MLSTLTRFGVNAPALPTPAPLPGLPAAFSRRAALFGAVASSGFLMAAACPPPIAGGASEADAMAALHAEADALRAAIERSRSDVEIDRLSDAVADLERRAVALHVSTQAGAVAALEWVRADLLHEDGTNSGFGFYPALIGQALDVLRQGGAS